MAQSVNVLSLDLSSPIVRATVVSVSGNNLTLLESHERSLSNPLFPTPPPSNQSSNSQTIESVPIPEEIKSLLIEMKTPWRSAVVTIPSDQGLSINISLPFKDTRQIQRVLALEIQDLIPFEVADFHLATALSTPSNEDDVGCDIRVDLTRKAFLRGLLLSLRDLGVDPRVVAFPSSAVSTLLHLAPGYFSPNCALLWSSEAGITVVGSVDGQPRASRNLSLPNNQEQKSGLLREIRLFIGHVERRYEVALEKIYIVGDVFSEAELKEFLGRDFEFVEPNEFFKTKASGTQGHLSALLAYQATVPQAQAQSNFRTGEFQFRPQLKELIAGLKTLIPFTAIFIASLVAAVGGTYLANASKISALQDALHERIKKTIPSFSAPPGQELSTILNQTQKIEEQLKDLGSLATLSPLEAFLAISQDLPGNLGLNVTELSIRETRVLVKGTAPDYGTLDKIESVFKKKSNIYCAIDVKNSAAGGRSANIGFDVTLTLC